MQQPGVGRGRGIKQADRGAGTDCRSDSTSRTTHRTSSSESEAWKTRDAVGSDRRPLEVAPDALERGQRRLSGRVRPVWAAMIVRSATPHGCDQILLWPAEILRHVEHDHTELGGLRTTCAKMGCRGSEQIGLVVELLLTRPAPPVETDGVVGQRDPVRACVIVRVQARSSRCARTSAVTVDWCSRMAANMPGSVASTLRQAQPGWVGSPVPGREKRGRQPLGEAVHGAEEEPSDTVGRAMPEPDVVGRRRSAAWLGTSTVTGASGSSCLASATTARSESSAGRPYRVVMAVVVTGRLFRSRRFLGSPVRAGLQLVRRAGALRLPAGLAQLAGPADDHGPASSAAAADPRRMQPNHVAGGELQLGSHPIQGGSADHGEHDAALGSAYQLADPSQQELALLGEGGRATGVARPSSTPWPVDRSTAGPGERFRCPQLGDHDLAQGPPDRAVQSTGRAVPSKVLLNRAKARCTSSVVDSVVSSLAVRLRAR